MFGGFLPVTSVNFRRQPKPTKKNIKKLIEQEKNKIQQSKRTFQDLSSRDSRLTQSIISISQQSQTLWYDLQDINLGRFQRPRIRNLKAEITQVLDECIRTGTITNLRNLANLGDPELSTFLREMDRHRDGFNRQRIQRIPFFLYESKQSGQSDSEEICSICHENYVDGVECIRLECKHVFHRKCISTWLRLKTSCPLCKKQVKPNNIPNPSGANNPSSSNNDQNARPNRG